MASQISLNGIHFSTNLYIVQNRDGRVILNQIVKIIYLNEKLRDIYFICKEFPNVNFNKHYQCYEVDTSHEINSLKAVSAEDVMQERQHPVSVQVVKGNNNLRFRAKRF